MSSFGFSLSIGAFLLKGFLWKISEVWSRSEWSKSPNEAPKIKNVSDHGFSPLPILFLQVIFYLRGKLAALWSNCVARVSFSDTENFSLGRRGDCGGEL